MIAREEYLKQLRLFREKEIIKVITGIRRSGKSTVLSQWIDELLASGVKKEQIIYVNFEDLAFEDINDYRTLYDYLINRLYPTGYTYVVLDEIQRIKDFQKAVDSLYIKKNVDIYVTGSNSDLLSSELASLLTGRYVEIKVMPISFKEYFSASSINDKYLAFDEYFNGSSLPYCLSLENMQAKEIYLEGVKNTIINVDIAKRHPGTDLNVLESILKFLLHSVGSLVSSTNIANALTSNNRKTTYNTVEKYIGYLKECFLIYEASRYDIKGKQHLKSLSKYYVVDIGFRKLMLANSASDLGHVLENVVYLELLRRYTKVSVGKVDDKEVDFVAENNEGIAYYQVAATVMDSDKLKTELAPLEKIREHYPKYLITLDRYSYGNHNGIKIVNAVDFLLS